MHKEETIVKYQDLLQQARNDLEEIRQSSQVEIEAIRSKMHNQATSALMQFREELKNSLSAHSSMYAAEQVMIINTMTVTVLICAHRVYAQLLAAWRRFSPFIPYFKMGKLNELQEVALQQDTAIALLTDKLKASSKEIWQWQLKNDTITKEFLHEKEKYVKSKKLLVDR